MTDRAAQAGSSVARVAGLRSWLSRQADIFCIIIVHLLPKRARRWAAHLEKGKS